MIQIDASQGEIYIRHSGLYRLRIFLRREFQSPVNRQLPNRRFHMQQHIDLRRKISAVRLCLHIALRHQLIISQLHCRATYTKTFR